MSEKTPIAVTSTPAPGPCTMSGVRGVAVRRERDDIVAAFRRGEGMIARELPDFRACAAALERPHVSQDGPARLRALQALPHLGVVRRISREELRRERAIGQTRAGPDCRRDTSLELHLRSGLARQDQQLAGHVLAVQILARIGLGVPHPVSVADQRAERHRAIERVEQVAERSREQCPPLS